MAELIDWTSEQFWLGMASGFSVMLIVMWMALVITDWRNEKK